MLYSDLENRLTGLADEAIEKAVRNYRIKIIKEAFSIAVQNNTEKEISLNNVHDAVKNLQKRIEKKAVLEDELNRRQEDYMKYTIIIKDSKNYLSLLSSLMAILGIFIIVFGMFYDKLYIVFDYLFSEDYISLTGAITIILSILISSVSSIARNKDEERIIESKRTNDLLLQLWAQIDYYGKELWSDYLVNNVSNETKLDISNINSSIDLIYQFLDPEEREKFRKLLDVRTKIVHEGYKALPSHEIEDAIMIANNINDKLKDMVKKENPDAALD